MGAGNSGPRQPSSPQEPLSHVPGTWREERAFVMEQQDRPQGH